MEEQNDQDQEDADEETKEEGDDEDAQEEEEKARAEGEDEPPAFGVQGEGGDSSVLEAANEEVNYPMYMPCIVFALLGYRYSGRV